MKIKFSQKHKELFKKLGIDVIYLFGSYAENKTHPMSDVDIGVVFAHPEKYKGNDIEVYTQLYNVFIDILPKEYLKKRFEMRAHEFDLVFLQFAPPDLSFNALRAHQVLYQSSYKREADFRFSALKKYVDFSHFLKMREDAIMARI